LGEIGLLGDDLIERLTTGATRMGYIGTVVFLILLVGWIGYKSWKQRIKRIISY